MPDVAIAALVKFGLRHQRRGAAAVAAAHAAVDRYGDLILARAHANVPRATGFLDHSLQKVAMPASPGQVQTDVVATAPYALAVHNRPAAEDGAHADEVTPEGHRGAGFLSRPLRFHQQRWWADTVSSVVRALQGKT